MRTSGFELLGWYVGLTVIAGLFCGPTMIAVSGLLLAVCGLLYAAVHAALKWTSQGAFEHLLLQQDEVH